MKKLIAILLSISILFGYNMSYAELDIEHNYKEGLQLLDDNWYLGLVEMGRIRV